ncbi:Pre-mRNA-splicing factor cwf19 [Coemansia brasiliensis]|uniref:Pre-mRNA-splicing factor cwf19 n=1 Tax=Coemansia brasiliensis TaxID=2650707 RepID=A0A9W8IC55_9FUNG|nr:Pre-mRNA-splicing factor cwf19 [Coemansia brasiliensis]
MRAFGTLLRGSKQVHKGIAQSLYSCRTSYAGISNSTRWTTLNKAYSTESSPKDDSKTEKPKEDKAKIDNERFPSRTFGGPEPKKERLFPESGPLSIPGISLFVLTAAGIFYYFTTEKERMSRERKEKLQKVEYTGKPEVGGAYELTDQDGKRVTDKTFHGKFHLVYFGFCHCPDICPDELDKIGDALDILDADASTKDTVQPVFITCDPQRDSPEAIKEYLKQFHPKFVGLTGTIDEVRTACKAYRVYFSKPPKVTDNQDYLVDHSIFSYLMDPDGGFVDVYGKDKDAKFMAEDIANRIEQFKNAARLTKSPDLAKLEKQLEAAMNGENSKPHDSKQNKVVVLPQVDSHGRRISTCNETRERQREAPDELTIQQMARIEKETEGDDTTDRELAAQIVRDSGFSNDLEYMDDNVERLSKRRQEKSSEQRKQAAIQDYKKMEAALDSCDMCFKQTENPDGSTLLKPPSYPMIALGNRVCLMLPNREPMNDGHCIIAPIEHVAGSSLKCDDDMWDEITNFMKCLMHMFAARQKGVVFLETVLSVQPSKAGHCAIECIPMPLSKAQDMPGYFTESLVSSDDEWSQHRKIIDTTVKTAPVAPKDSDLHEQDTNHLQARQAIRRGGFRNRMTAKMPYFHVWFDPYGGMGHVIENSEKFPPWFGREVVAGVLDLPPAVYRRPRRLKESHDQRCDRADEWKKQFGWSKFDWTKMLEAQQ